MSCKDLQASHEDDQHTAEANAEGGNLAEGGPDNVAYRGGRTENKGDKWDLRRQCLDLQVPRC